MTLEEFVARLEAELDEVNRAEYFSAPILRRCLGKALRGNAPPENQYPRMLFSLRSTTQVRVVRNQEEEAAALAGGEWVATPPPPFEPDFPRTFVERPVPLGGVKSYDLRAVFLRSSADEEQLFAAVDRDGWVRSDGNQWGGRYVSLGELTEERKQILITAIQSGPLEPAEQEPPATQE
jgi:hypothetical protein